jgi:hypothetical protein
MEAQAFSPKELRLNPTDLIPPDESDDEDVEVQWLEYCLIAKAVDEQVNMAMAVREVPHD